MQFSVILGLCLLPLLLFNITDAIHLTGRFDTKQFYTFLVKYGFQRTDRHQADATHGFIFGNVTASGRQNGRFVKVFPMFTLAVLNRQDFLNVYANRLVVGTKNRDEACTRMFANFSRSSSSRQSTAVANNSAKCSHTKSHFRRIPCPIGKLCVDNEDQPWSVIKGHQFTYVMEDFKQPLFWYVSMVACYQNTTTCKWHHWDRPPDDYQLQYDIWLVNGNPNSSTFAKLNYQFSFERQNTLEMYTLFMLIYVVLVPLQCHAVKTQRHPVTRLFTASLMLDFFALLFILLHTLRFAIDGQGYSQLSMFGDVLDILSRTSFMLLLLLLAKGWAVTRLDFSWKPLVFIIWLCYGIVHILLYVWNLTEVDIIEDIDEYETWPGWLIIVFRTLIMIWFLYELRTTMFYEHNVQKLQFLLHFGASSLVWFIYLPILALIALNVPALWRYRLLLGITYSVDCFAYIVMTHLLWPTRSEQYFLLKVQTFADIDELDEFNEAPHIINTSYTSLSTLGSHNEDIIRTSTKVPAAIRS